MTLEVSRDQGPFVYHLQPRDLPVRSVLPGQFARPLLIVLAPPYPEDDRIQNWG